MTSFFHTIAHRLDSQDPSLPLPDPSRDSPDKCHQLATQILMNLQPHEAEKIAKYQKMNGLQTWVFVHLRWCYLLFSSKTAKVGGQILNEWLAIRNEKEKRSIPPSPMRPEKSSPLLTRETRNTFLHEKEKQLLRENPGVPKILIQKGLEEVARSAPSTNALPKNESFDPLVLAEALLRQQDPEEFEILVPLLHEQAAKKEQTLEELLTITYLQCGLSAFKNEPSLPELVLKQLRSISLEQLEKMYKDSIEEQQGFINSPRERKLAIGRLLKTLLQKEFHKETDLLSNQEEETAKRIGEKESTLFKQKEEWNSLLCNIEKHEKEIAAERAKKTLFGKAKKSRLLQQKQAVIDQLRPNAEEQEETMENLRGDLRLERASLASIRKKHEEIKEAIAFLEKNYPAIDPQIMETLEEWILPPFLGLFGSSPLSESLRSQVREDLKNLSTLLSEEEKKALLARDFSLGSLVEKKEDLLFKRKIDYFEKNILRDVAGDEKQNLLNAFHLHMSNKTNHALFSPFEEQIEAFFHQHLASSFFTSLPALQKVWIEDHPSHSFSLPDVRIDNVLEKSSGQIAEEYRKIWQKEFIHSLVDLQKQENAAELEKNFQLPADHGFNAFLTGLLCFVSWKSHIQMLSPHSFQIQIPQQEGSNVTDCMKIPMTPEEIAKLKETLVKEIQDLKAPIGLQWAQKWVLKKIQTIDLYRLFRTLTEHVFSAISVRFPENLIVSMDEKREEMTFSTPIEFCYKGKVLWKVSGLKTNGTPNLFTDPSLKDPLYPVQKVEEKAFDQLFNDLFDLLKNDLFTEELSFLKSAKIILRFIAFKCTQKGLASPMPSHMGSVWAKICMDG